MLLFFDSTKIKKALKLFILALVILGVAAAAFFYFKNQMAEKNVKSRRPNIILISIDSLRADHISASGYVRRTTPNIDALAKEGVYFKNYITQAYLTPISEMAVHTGMYPSSSGVVGFDTVLPDNFLTVAQILKKYGYRNAAFGNSMETLLYPALKTSFIRGYDLYNINPVRERLPMVESLVNFATLEPDKPFFIWLALGSVHFKYGKFPENFSDPNYSGPLKSQRLNWFNGVFPWIYKNILYEIASNGKIAGKTSLNQEDAQYVIDKYDGDILATDAWIGELLKRIKNEGLEKNTIIILQSEHGEDLNEHGYIHHYDIFDTMIKTPLIIKNPFLSSKNITVEEQVQSINILPTILDFLKIPKAHQIEGVSLLPLLEKNEKLDANDYIFIERIPLWERVIFTRDKNLKDTLESSWSADFFDSGMEKISLFYKKEAVDLIQNDAFIKQRDVAVRTSEWKLIFRQTAEFQTEYSWWNVLSGEKPGVAPFELYNLRSDPGETKNVIQQYPDIAQILKNKLMDFVKKTDNKKMPEIEKPIYDYF